MRGPDQFKTNRARSLRKADNDAEAVLWSELRGRRLNGFKFVRQFPIDRYFADFACREKKLVVEVDGSQHAEEPKDRVRDERMNVLGWSVARFWAHEILQQRQAVLNTIVEILDGRITDVVTAPDFRFSPSSDLASLGHLLPASGEKDFPPEGSS